MTDTSFGAALFAVPGVFLLCLKLRELIMKDRTAPCIYYVCKDADCKKGFVKVDLKKCKNCPKYQPRKSSEKKESIRNKRQKDKDRHDQWRNYI